MFVHNIFALLLVLTQSQAAEEGSGDEDFDHSATAGDYDYDYEGVEGYGGRAPDYAGLSTTIVPPSNGFPPNLPKCHLRDVPEFIDTLKKHIKSVNKAGELDCSDQEGFVGEICKYGDDWADGDTDIIIKWNDCGKISFMCSVHDADYAPRLPEEVTTLGLDGDCPADNTLIYAILGGVGGLVVLILAVIVGYRFKKK